MCRVRPSPLVSLVLAAATSVVLLSLVGPYPAAAQVPPVQPGPGGSAVAYQPPLVAPVADPFRAPATPFGPGNRGIEYATTPGTPVGAVGAGTVVFAGPVAGALHVTVLHADGIRTSYSFLARILVVAGQRVARGQAIGLAGSRFHLGARTGPRTYIDPALLWSGPPHVYLVPADGAAPAAPGAGPGDLSDLAAVGELAAPVAGLAAGHATAAGAVTTAAPT